MSSDNTNMNDPLAFLRNMWSGMGVSMPGMVTPTFDVDELDKRIKDMKAVESWLRMNLSMLQMTIQGLEMQRSTVGAVQAMSHLIVGRSLSDITASMGAFYRSMQAYRRSLGKSGDVMVVYGQSITGDFVRFDLAKETIAAQGTPALCPDAAQPNADAK